jgi:hypothetical protein
MRPQPVPKSDLSKFDLAKYPALKPGVNFFKVPGKDSSYIYIGFSHRGIELNFETALELLSLFNGSRTLGKIVPAIGVDLKSTETIYEVLRILSNERLIDFRSSPVPSLISTKELLPANFVNSANRMRAEENLYSWHPEIGVEKDAGALIGLRRNFSIIIYGRNRLALSLFAVLQASGFTLIKLTDRTGSTSNDSAVQIEPSEVCGLAIRGSDVGLRKALVLADLARNSQLFPAEKLEFPTKPNFIISTESIPQETLQLWLSDEIAHFPISNLIENRVVLGPIVIPGKTPCLNCLNLWRSEQFPHHNSFEMLIALDNGEGKGLELPSAQVALLSGLVATHVIQYCTLQNGTSQNHSVKLIGATLAINLFDPIGFGSFANQNTLADQDYLANQNTLAGQDYLANEEIGYRYWQPHPACGCQQLL